MCRYTRFVISCILGAFAFSSGAQAQAKLRDVSIGLQAAITSMDPHFHNLSPNNALSLHIFEPLIKRDENQKLVPGLAMSWKALDDLTWEFKLRRNVQIGRAHV